MKKIYLILFVFLLTIKSLTGLCTTFTITTSGFTFTPDSISANLGDTVIFSLPSIHSAVEVSQATWNVNGNTSNGGFQLPLGGGTIILNQVKTYYYVCGVHFALGMKGRLFVSNPSGINLPSTSIQNLEITPNPASTSAIIKSNLPSGKENQLRLFNILGKNLYIKDNISSLEYIDLSKFPEGLYFVEIRCEGILLDKKFVVSR